MADNGLKEESKIIILSSTYYATIADMLEEGVKKAAVETQWHKDFTNLYVAGALELPLALSFIAERYKDELANNELGVVVLGCLLRGETEHFSLICNEVFNGLQRVALEHSIPLGTGVLACDKSKSTLERAEKAGGQAFIACHSLLTIKQYLEER